MCRPWTDGCLDVRRWMLAESPTLKVAIMAPYRFPAKTPIRSRSAFGASCQYHVDAPPRLSDFPHSDNDSHFFFRIVILLNYFPAIRNVVDGIAPGVNFCSMIWRSTSRKHPPLQIFELDKLLWFIAQLLCSRIVYSCFYSTSGSRISSERRPLVLFQV